MLSSVERLSIEFDMWSHVGIQLPTPLSHTIIQEVQSDYFVVFGGKNQTQHNRDVFMYGEGQWY